MTCVPNVQGEIHQCCISHTVLEDQAWQVGQNPKSIKGQPSLLPLSQSLYCHNADSDVTKLLVLNQPMSNPG